MRYCSFNGCTNKIERGSYCEQHKRSKKKKRKKVDIYHSENKSFYNSKEWKDLRDLIYELRKGCCERCGKFIFGRRAHVHHKVKIKDNFNLRLDQNNLRLLCPVCHTIEENEEKKEVVFASYFTKQAPPTK